MNIGEKIKSVRNERGYTQKELASKANISRSYLADIEKNRYNPSIEVLNSISKALHVPIFELLIDGQYEFPKIISLGDYMKKVMAEKNISLQQLSDRTTLPTELLTLIQNNEFRAGAKHIKLISIGLDESYEDLARKVGYYSDTDVDVSDIIKEQPKPYVTSRQTEFKTPQAAMEFILKQPALAAYGGYNVNEMSDEEIVEFANELLRQLELISYKYKK